MSTPTKKNNLPDPTRATPTELITKAMHGLGNSPEKMKKGVTISRLSRSTGRPQDELLTAMEELVNSGHVTMRRSAGVGAGRHTVKFWPTTLVKQKDGFFMDYYKSLEWSDIRNPLVPDADDSAQDVFERLSRSQSDQQ